MVAARVTTGLAGRVARACIAALFRDKSLPTPRSRYTPRQNSPSTSTGGHPPRKYSPSTAKTLRFGLFSARWAKNVAFATRALPAGRIFSRRPQPTSRAGYPHRYKTLPAHGVHGRNRYKTLPAHGVHGHNRYKTLRAIPASRPTGTKLSPHSPTRTRTLKVACNSITARIRAYSKALESQGSVITARRTHWGIACETAEHPERRHTKRGR